jgi:hypothetical protein
MLLCDKRGAVAYSLPVPNLQRPKWRKDTDSRQASESPGQGILVRRPFSRPFIVKAPKP